MEYCFIEAKQAHVIGTHRLGKSTNDHFLQNTNSRYVIYELTENSIKHFQDFHFL